MFRLVNKLKNRKGFTLIELIVVLAVLAIIMAIAVPRFIGVQNQAKIDADYATVASVAKAAELYYAKNNVVPTISQLSGGYIESDNLDLQSVSITMNNTNTAISITSSSGVSVTVTTGGTPATIKYPK